MQWMMKVTQQQGREHAEVLKESFKGKIKCYILLLIKILYIYHLFICTNKF